MFVLNLTLVLMAIFYYGCGHIEYIKVSSKKILTDSENLNGVEREIAQLRAVMLEQNFFKEMPEDKQEECKIQVDNVSSMLRNFEKIKIGMSEKELRSLGFDIAAANVIKQSGYKALNYWFGGNTPLVPPFVIMGQYLPQADADFVDVYPIRYSYMIVPNNGEWSAFWSNKNVETKSGFDYAFDIIILKGKVFAARESGGIMNNDKEEYESKRSKIGKGFKNPIDWIKKSF